MVDQVKINAMKESLKSSDLTDTERMTLQDSIKNDRLYSLIGKGVLLTGFVFIPDWKKPAPIHTRHIPMAIAAVLGCFAIDHFVRRHFWNLNEAVVKRITGFNGQIFMSPDAMKNMKQMYKGKKKTNLKDKTTSQEELLQED